jgi:hypothetical protein
MDALQAIRREEELRGRWNVAGGKYFKAMTGSPGGTGHTVTVVTAFSSTAAIFEIENPSQIYPAMNAGSPPGMLNAAQDPLGQGSIFLYPHYLRLTVVTAQDGTGTSIQWVGVLDPKLRFSAGGFQPVSPEFGAENVLVMNQAGFAPVAGIHVGGVTLNAAGANRLIMGRGVMKDKGSSTNLATVNDEYLWTFGNMENVSGATKAGATATAPAQYVQSLGPVCVPPQSSFAILAWYPGLVTGWAFDFEFAWWERQW